MPTELITYETRCRDKIAKLPRGRILGESSISFMIGSQTKCSDLHTWGKLGNRGWNLNSSMLYYRKTQIAYLLNGATRAFYPTETEYVDLSYREASGPI